MFAVEDGVFKETQLFGKTAAHINRLNPAFVLSNGDLVNEPCDEKQLSEALQAMRKLDSHIAVYLIPGNHDIADAPTRQTLEWYRRQIGKDWYSFNYGGWHFIGLNSCIIANGENVQPDVEKQWDWLNKDLEQAVSSGNLHTMVFMHHPLFLSNTEEEDDYFNIPRRNRRIYVDLFEKYNVDTVLAGHLHKNNLAANSGLEVITTGPVGMPLGPDPSGFRVVKVYADHIKHKYFGLDEVISLDF